MEIDPARLDVLLRRVRLEVEGGPLPSAQVAVAHAGQLVAFETYGDATPDSRYILQSVGRSVVAGVVWKLLGDGAHECGRGGRPMGSVVPRQRRRAGGR